MSLSLTNWLLLSKLASLHLRVGLLLLKLWLLSWIDLFLLLRRSNFLTWLSLTLLNLSCLTFYMKLMHLSRSTWVTKDARLVLLWLPLSSLTSIVLLTVLTLSCINCHSALSIIFLAFALMNCLLLSSLSLILTGTKFCSIHLSMKILWFLKFLKLLDGTECQILLDTGASKSFVSKSNYLCCKSLHTLPKFASKTQRIQLGNGQYVSVHFVIPIIIDMHGHRFKIYTFVPKIHATVGIVLWIKMC